MRSSFSPRGTRMRSCVTPKRQEISWRIHLTYALRTWHIPLKWGVRQCSHGLWAVPPARKTPWPNSIPGAPRGAKLNAWIALREMEGAETSSPALFELKDTFEGSATDSQHGAASLIAGQAGKTFLRDLVVNGDLERIARLWIL